MLLLVNITGKGQGGQLKIELKHYLYKFSKTLFQYVVRGGLAA